MVSNLLIFQPKSFQQWMVMPKIMGKLLKGGGPTNLSKPKPNPAWTQNPVICDRDWMVLGKKTIPEFNDLISQAFTTIRWFYWVGGASEKKESSMRGLRPSEASGIPTALRMVPIHKKLQWDLNAHGHWANCRKCGLRKGLYFSQQNIWGLFMPRQFLLGPLLLEIQFLRPLKILLPGPLLLILLLALSYCFKDYELMNKDYWVEFCRIGWWESGGLYCRVVLGVW